MPLPLYLQHEQTISEQPSGMCSDFTKTEAFRLLKSDPKSKLVISCKSAPTLCLPPLLC